MKKAEGKKLNTAECERWNSVCVINIWQAAPIYARCKQDKNLHSLTTSLRLVPVDMIKMHRQYVTWLTRPCINGA